MEARCKHYDVSGQWTLQQRNGYGVTLNLQQTGTAITGTAKHDVTATIGGGVAFAGPIPTGPAFSETREAAPGTVEGSIQGNDFFMNISWGSNNDTHGIYRGKVTAQGRLEGSMYHKEIPKNKSTWVSSTIMQCADAAAVEPVNSAPSPSVNPIRSTGRRRTPAIDPIKSTGKSPSQTQSSAAAPTIEANPAFITIPDGQSQGTVTVTWNAGPDHPHVRVLVKESGQDGERALAAQVKGTRQVTVERGTNYLFILKDAGHQLAKAVVISRR